jgi:hypothetical protein
MDEFKTQDRLSGGRGYIEVPSKEQWTEAHIKEYCIKYGLIFISERKPNSVGEYTYVFLKK